MRETSRRPLAAALALVCCLSMIAPVAAAPNGTSNATAARNATGGPNPCVGTVTEPARGMTVISVQGFRFGENGGKRPAKLVGVGPRGQIRWVHQMSREYGVVWSYDVDPMPNGDVYVTATLQNESTLVYEFNPRTQEKVWQHVFDIGDTHDTDLINDGTAILVANMRNYNASTGVNNDRIFVYNRTRGKITWQWRFDAHYDRSKIAENYTHDWTHVNDVDEIGDGLYLASPRNFDQVIAVNRSTNETAMKLGADERKSILNEQHNPDYLESRNGTPTLIVADSENDRIVEYANGGNLTDGDGWTRTWTLEGNFDWPRDADRLPNGHTLISDSSNNRVVEVTPRGKVVWEFYAPWLVYDAARVSVPGEHARGPTMRDLNAAGTYRVHGGAGYDDNATRLKQCDSVLQNVSGWAEGQSPTTGTPAMWTTTHEPTTVAPLADETTERGGATAGGRDGGANGTAAATGLPGFGALAALAGLLAVSGMVLSRRR